MSLLKLNNVKYEYINKYNRVKAVNGVTYSFEAGKVYAIVGKSGSGKTTLLSIMAGLDLPTSGEVLYKGVPTTQLDRTKYRKEDISVIYQAYNLLPLLNSIENIMLPVKIQGKSNDESKIIANDLFKQMELEEHCKTNYPSMLSGGEQQRVAIARSLSSRPSILFADEPTGNLDVENGNKIIDTLIKLAHEQNYCVIIITHDTSIKEKVDVVLEMKDGRFINQDCATDDIELSQDGNISAVNNKNRFISYLKNMKRRTVIWSSLILVLLILSSIFVPLGINHYYKSISTFTKEQLLEDYEYLCDSIAENWPYYSIAIQNNIDVEGIFKKYEKRINRKPTDRYFFTAVTKMLNELSSKESLGKIKPISYKEYTLLKKSDSIKNKKAYKFLFDSTIEEGYSKIKNLNVEIGPNIQHLSFDENVTLAIEKENEIARIKIKSFDFDENDENLLSEYKEKFEQMYSKITDYKHVIFDLTDTSGESTYIWKNLIVSFNSSKEYTYTTYNLFNASSNNLKYYGSRFTTLSEFEYYDNINNEDKLYINSFIKNITRISSYVSNENSIGSLKKWIIVNNKTSGSVNNFVDFCNTTNFATTVGVKTAGGYSLDTLTLFSLPNTKLLLEYDGAYSMGTEGQILQNGIEPKVLAESNNRIFEKSLDEISQYNEKYGDIVNVRIDVNKSRKASINNSEFDDITKYTPDYRFEEDVFDITQMYRYRYSRGANRITKEQAIEDINSAFDLLKYTYGAYYYFGGDKVYNEAKQKILSGLDEITSDGEVSSNSLALLFIDNLKFIKDKNFSISNMAVSENAMLYISYDYIIKEKSGKYYVDYNGEEAEILSIDGDNILDNYIKKTINANGKISYMLAKMYNYKRTYKIYYDGVITIKNNNTNLDLNITWNTAKNDGDTVKHPYRLKDYDGLSVYSIGGFSENFHYYNMKFYGDSKELRNKKTFVIDLRGNQGDFDKFLYMWASLYLRDEFTTKVQIAKKDTKLASFIGRNMIENIPYTWQIEQMDRSFFYKNDNLIFVLVDERVSKAGEKYLRILRSIENVIVVGSNTKGGTLVENVTTKYLYNSGITFSFGNVLTLYHDESYDEVNGFLPDLWVEPKNALDYVIKLYKNYDIEGYLNY